MQAKAREFLDLVQRGMLVIEYAAKFLQLSHFRSYLIPTEEKKVKKFEWGLNSRIQIIMSCFNIWDFYQLVNGASIYEESLKENATKYANQKMKVQGTDTSIGGAGPTKRMVVESFPPQRSQGCTSGNPLVPSRRNQTLELCKKCNHVHQGPYRMAIGTCYWCSQFGHFSKDCVGKGVAQKPLVPTQVYALVPGKLEGGSKVVTVISICQQKYALDILDDSGLLACKPSKFPMDYSLRLSKHEGLLLDDPTPYRRLIGRLLYLTITRPDLVYSIQVLSQFMSQPRQPYIDAAIKCSITSSLLQVKGCSFQFHLILSSRPFVMQIGLLVLTQGRLSLASVYFLGTL